ncbi:hypothetical protein AAF712_012121 [Marasmius tenuissimus]|uniref:Uncharacterized protein n=1 Tax=Marasmius tenuissimus TaxID=585030 RepID=A0ABR2ZJB6_9AGAR
MRGYTELYQANTTSMDLRSYIGSYISTQFNSVSERAASPGSNIYGSHYDGPPGVQFSNETQMGAIGALLGGLAVAVGGENATTASRSRSTSAGAIAGAVTGSIALFGLAIASVWTYIRRRRAKAGDFGRVTPWKPPTHSIVKRQQSKWGDRLPPPETFDVANRNTLLQAPENGASDTVPLPAAMTEEWILVLNQRLGDEGRWDPNETPPEYVSQLEISTPEGRST